MAKFMTNREIYMRLSRFGGRLTVEEVMTQLPMDYSTVLKRLNQLVDDPDFDVNKRFVHREGKRMLVFTFGKSTRLWRHLMCSVWRGDSLMA